MSVSDFSNHHHSFLQPNFLGFAIELHRSPYIACVRHPQEKFVLLRSTSKSNTVLVNLTTGGLWSQLSQMVSHSVKLTSLKSL